MHYSKLAAREEKFQDTGVAVGRKFKLVQFELPVKGEDLKLQGYTVRPADDYDGYYYKQKYAKKKIVTHFTVGHLQGDINSLTNPQRGHVSTAFVLGRDGTVYQLFQSYFWSYHLGRGAVGGNGTNSKFSVGIEISNYGPLIKRGNNLETVYSRREGHDVYCSLNDKDQYIELEESYRGYKYYTAFTDEQYSSLIILLRYLTARYEIPRAFIEESKRYDTSIENASFEGIQTHVHYRKDKFDIGPAFDWDRVIAGVTAETYTNNPFEKKVADLKVLVADLKKQLKKAEEDLMFAEQDYEDALAAGSRSVDGAPDNRDEKDMDSLFRRRTLDAGEDGYFSEEMDKSVFYLVDDDEE